MQATILALPLLVCLPAQKFQDFPETRLELSYHGHGEDCKVTIRGNRVVIHQGKWTGDGILHPCGRVDLIWGTEESGPRLLATYQFSREDGSFDGSYMDICGFVSYDVPWITGDQRTKSRYSPKRMNQ